MARPWAFQMTRIVRVLLFGACSALVPGSAVAREEAPAFDINKPAPAEQRALVAVDLSRTQAAATSSANGAKSDTGIQEIVAGCIGPCHHQGAPLPDVPVNEFICPKYWRSKADYDNRFQAPWVGVSLVNADGSAPVVPRDAYAATMNVDATITKENFFRVYTYAMLNSQGQWLYWAKIEITMYSFGSPNNKIVLYDSFGNYVVGPPLPWWGFNFGPILNCALPAGRYWIYNQSECEIAYRPFDLAGGACPTATPTPTPTRTPTPTPIPAPPTPTPTPAPTSAPNQAPQAQAPVGCIASGANPTFRWTAVQQASSYDLRIFRDDPNGGPPFLMHVAAPAPTTTSYTPPPNVLGGGVQYRWIVRGRNQYGDGPPSGPGGNGDEFTLACGSQLYDAPRLLSPTTCPSAAPPLTFSWTGLLGADRYFIEVWDLTDGRFLPFNTKNTSFVDDAVNVTRGHQYEWRAHGRTASGVDGPWSNWGRFCVPEPELQQDPATRPPCPAGQCCNHEMIPNPVAVASGSVFLDHLDLHVPGIGPALAFTRSYNSANNNRNGLLGPGWSHSFERSIRTSRGNVDNDIVTLTEADGTDTVFWDRDRDGKYEAYLPASEESWFVWSNGAFVHHFRGGGSETYSIAGRLVEVRDRLGRALTFFRQSEPDGRIMWITNASGRSLGFTYYSGERLRDIKGPGNVEIATFTYDSSGRLHTVRYKDGSGYTFAYTGTGLLTTVTDTSGRVIDSHTYYPDGRARTAGLAEGRNTRTLVYEPDRTLVTDALGHTTTYEFALVNRTRRVVKTRGPCGSCGGGGSETEEWTYDTAGRIKTHKDAGGKVTHHEYDPLTGDLTAVRDAMLNAAIYTYDAEGRVTSVISPDNSAKRFTYVDAGPATITETINGTTSRTSRIEYDTHGLPVRTIDARGKETVFEYYLGTRDLKKVTTPAGFVTYEDYDLMGRPQTVRDALGRATRTTYDTRGRVSTVTHPDGTRVEFGYDLAGRLQIVKDALGRESRTFYDAYGRVDASQDPARNQTRSTYDLMSRPTALIDAEGRTTGFEYDGYGRVTHTTYPGGATEMATYDRDGRVSSTTNRKGVTTTFSYDGLGRLVRKTYSDGSPAVSFSYDVMGRMTSASNAADTLSWTYDHVGRVVTETSQRHGSTVAYTYDAAGNRLSASLNGTSVAQYVYDDASRLDSMQHGSMVFDFEYNEVSQRRSLLYPNGVRTSYDYDPVMGRLKKLETRSATGVVSSFEYDYDVLGNRTRKATPDFVESYTYDSLSRLVGIDRTAQGTPTQQWGFGYDRVGNRTADRFGGQVLGAAYDVRNQLLSKAVGGPVPVEGQLSEAGNVQVNGQPARAYAGSRFAGQVTATSGSNTFSVQATDASGNSITKQYSYDVSGQPAAMQYDTNGNLIQKAEGGSTWTYEWTVDNQLRRVLLNGNEVARFAYDPLGRRVEKVAGTATTAYLYDGQDILRETVTSTSGTQTALYIHGPGIDAPLAKKDLATGAIAHLHADGLGSIVKHTDSAGNVVHSYQYDAWGNIEVGASKSGHAFTGREHDAETGLYYYRARYYDAKLGIFISEDPAKDGVNHYAYVGGAPTSLIDPSGLAALGPSLPEMVMMFAGFSANMQARMTGQTSSAAGPATFYLVERAHELERESTIQLVMLATRGMGSGGIPGAGACEGLKLRSQTSGPFSVRDWTGYPGTLPQPEGPFRLLTGEEYLAARRAADAANAALRAANPARYEGKQIHEIHPVKFGGSPTDVSNKVVLTPGEHAPFTAFWNRLMRYLQ